MTDDSQLAFSAGLAVAKADRLLRSRSNTALALSGSGNDPFTDAEEVNAGPLTMLDAKAKAWATQQFWQEDDNTLHLAPLAFYPGIIVARPAELPPANSKLWARLIYTLVPRDYGYDDLGWSGGIALALVDLTWSADNLTQNNVIFPGDKASSLPPGGSLVLHYQLGRTDDNNAFTLEINGLDTSTPLLTPPL